MNWLRNELPDRHICLQQFPFRVEGSGQCSVLCFNFSRRESMKQTIAGDKTTKEKSKKAGTFLCAKKNPKKKKKKAPYSVSYNDGGYPLYSTNTVDGECC